MYKFFSEMSCATLRGHVSNSCGVPVILCVAVLQRHGEIATLKAVYH